MTDPATNALALQMQYGDDELKKDIEDLIRAVVKDELVKLFNDPSFGQRFITNNSYMLDQMAKNAFKNMIASINTY